MCWVCYFFTTRITRNSELRCASMLRINHSFCISTNNPFTIELLKNMAETCKIKHIDMAGFEGSHHAALRGKVVVIVGASSGIGRAAALEFAKNGSSLVLLARREGMLQELAGLCRRLGAYAALAVPVDV